MHHIEFCDDINRKWRIFLREHQHQMSLFSNAFNDEERLRIIHRYYWLPHHREIYMLYCHLNAIEDSQTDIHAKRITLQAIDNASNPALQDIRPSDDEYIYALTHHLSNTEATEFHTIMDVPNSPRDISCLSPRTWDSNEHVVTNVGYIKITSRTLQWFKVRLTFQEHVLHSINNTIHGPDHKRFRFMNLHSHYLKKKALDTSYQHLLTVMHAPNKHKFLAYHLIRELEILHDGEQVLISCIKSFFFLVKWMHIHES